MQQASLRGVPLGRMTIEPLSAAAALATRIAWIIVSTILFDLTLVVIIAVIIAWVGAVILFPPLGAVTIIVFVMRRARKKRKSVNTMPGG
jgi:Flp pilus assembly protein TadB